MCGICGFVGKTRDRENVLGDMMQAIIHRGPDSDGKYCTDDACLGFRRLSIIDLDEGSQPMYNEEEDKVLVFNGEIYNYQSLRSTLLEKGHKFRNHSDSEVLLHGYEEYREKLLDKLRGMFAFAIWDEKEQRLFAARDPFGIKPFYYALIDGCFVFASEIKSILKFPGYKKELNEEALEQYLSFQYSALPETFFKGIYKLLPGSYLTYENRRLEIHTYYDPVLTPDRSLKEEELVKATDEVMGDSIKHHMISDVEVGAFLSSGVDSSLVAARCGATKTFTVGFLDDRSKYNEIHFAKETAKKLNVENTSKVVTKEEYWDAVPKVMYYLDEPSGDAAAVALYFVAQEAAKQVKVVTSGEGADELFGGYNIYLEPKALKWISWIPKPLRRGIGKVAEKLPAHMRGRNYLLRGSKDVEERFIGNANIFSEKERMSILKNPGKAVSPEELLRKKYKKMERQRDINKMQYIDLTCWMPGDILQKADKMSMAHSLELRVPFLDKEVFEVARKIPTKLKTRHYTTKYILRQASWKYLPRETADKKKLGFPVPIRVWLKEEETYKEVKNTFTGETASKYFETDKLVGLLDAHRRGDADNSRKIWTVYAFLVWYRIFFEEQSEAGMGNK